jgi:hypothetical protein
MALEQLAYLAEIIGVILVIASLIYVAQQLRQNTEMMRSRASGERVQRDAELSGMVSGSGEFAEIWLKGRTEFESLSEVERIRLIFHSRSAILHWHNMFGMREQNLLSDSDWSELVWLIEHLIRGRQDTLEAWRMFRGSFDERFQEFLDARIEVAGITA